MAAKGKPRKSSADAEEKRKRRLKAVLDKAVRDHRKAVRSLEPSINEIEKQSNALYGAQSSAPAAPHAEGSKLCQTRRRRAQVFMPCIERRTCPERHPIIEARLWYQSSPQDPMESSAALAYAEGYGLKHPCQAVRIF